MNDHIAEASEKVGRPQIREIFLRNGARIEPDRDDLPDWIYESASELLELAAPAVQGEPAGVIRESDVMGIAPYADIWPWLEPGTKLYTAPQSAEQQPAPGPITEALLEAIWKHGFDSESLADQAYCQPLIIARNAVEEAEQQPAPDVAGLVDDAECLLERLSEMEDLLVEDELCRAYLGHVAPAAARLGAKIAVHRVTSTPT